MTDIEILEKILRNRTCAGIDCDDCPMDEVYFDVDLVKPDLEADSACPMCRGRGCYTALHVGEYEEMPMSVKCACTNRKKG